jgi:hypothetical protein
LLYADFLYAQKTVELKAYIINGSIEPEMINDHFDELIQQNKSYLDRYDLPQVEIGKIENLNGYGFQLRYSFYRNIGIGIGWETYKKQIMEYEVYDSYLFFSTFLTKRRSEIQYEFTNFLFSPYVKYDFDGIIKLYLSLGPVMNFGNFMESYYGVYDYYYRSWSFKQKYSTKKKSKEINYHVDFHADIDLLYLISFELGVSYRNTKNMFQGNYSFSGDELEWDEVSRTYVRDSEIIFDTSGFYFSGGIKIGIF